MTKVFITGATGFVGTAVTKELVAHGYTVIGLARSEASANKLRELGASVQYGDLEDSASLTAGAKAADAVAHLGFRHDFTSPTHDMKKNCELDLAALTALAEGIKGTNKVFINTNGLIGGPSGALMTESSEKSDFSPRKISETYFKQLASEGVRAITIRLPPTVHGMGDPNFIPTLINGAKRNGFSAYVGDGAARWPTVHVNDAAVLYRLALEKDLKPGQFLHPIEDEMVATRDIAELIAKKTNTPVKSISKEEALKLYGFIGFALSTDDPVSKEETVKVTGWKPKEITLLEDLAKNYPA